MPRAVPGIRRGIQAANRLAGHLVRVLEPVAWAGIGFLAARLWEVRP